MQTFYLKHLTRLHPRSKNILQNIVKSFLFKGLSIALSYLIIPISLKYLGAEKYGLWITLMTIINWFTISDIGLGNGLRNKLTEALTQKDYAKASEYVSTTYFIITIIALSLYFIALTISNYINWADLLNTNQEYGEEIRLFLKVTFFLFSLQLIFNLIIQVSNAFQVPFYGSLINFIFNLIIFISVNLLVSFDKSASLIYMGFIMSGIPVTTYFAFNLFLFKYKFNVIIISYKNINLQHFKSLITLGIYFFLGQITYILNYSISNVLISYNLGPSSVTVYNIVFRYFSFITLGFTLVITPYWSNFTEAYTLKDYRWIRNTMKNLSRLVIFISIFSIFMILLSKPIFRLWIGTDFEAPFGLVILLGIYVLTLTFVTPYLYFLNGVNQAKFVFYISVLGAFLNIMVVVLLFKFSDLGILAAVIGPIFSNAFLILKAPRKYNALIKNNHII